uniref:Nidogen-1 n=1 Tax=Parascaris univalens TaxID=6257 RepID=A0A915B249_PARUN
ISGIRKKAAASRTNIVEGGMLPHRAFVSLSFLLSLALATQLYRYGTEEGDQEIEFSSEPSAVSLDVPIIYFEETQNEIFISSNGLVSFGRPVSGSGIKDLDTEGLSAIAVFYVPTSGGTIYYRGTSSDNDLLNDLTDRIRRNFPRRDSTEFRALHAILVTWDAMTTSDAKGVNEYQLALATDGLSSYAVLLYNRIDWTTSDGRAAQAGLYYSDGRRQSMVNSGTANIKELVNLSNNQKEGSYIFRISGSSPEDPRGSVEDDYTYNDYEPEYDPDENVRRPQQPPSHQRPVETISENDINHDVEPAYHRTHASIVHSDESSTEGSEKANAIEEQPEGESQPIEIMPDVHPQPQEMPQIMLQLPPQPDPQSTQQSAGDLHETSSEHTAAEDELYKKHQKQRVETIEEDISPDDSRVDAPPASSKTSVAEREMLLSCAEASETVQPCHTHARCIDYHPGYCCECLHGYYGNGKECLKNGDPQRINGGFEGVINGEAIGRTELHTYVMTAEGRAYTALSQIPPHHGRSLLLLNPIAGAMGWLFAKVESPSSYNGFQLTGGLFNRTVNVHIGDRSAVTIKQQFSGRDIYHYFKAQIFVTGTLPQLAENAEVIYPDHEEEYRREGPGFVRSYSARDVLVKENGHERTLRLTVDQQIHYKECPYKAFDKDSVVVLRVSRPHVIYDAEERIVRYASANSVTNERSLNLVEAAEPEPQEPSRTRSQQPVQKSKDPCGQGNHVCTLPNMFCTAVEPSYRCECERGFQAQPDASTHLGWKCVDLDECQRGDHTCGQNAVCTNTDGGFDCKCRSGYQGDGHRCHTMTFFVMRPSTYYQPASKNYSNTSGI